MPQLPSLDEAWVDALDDVTGGPDAELLNFDFFNDDDGVFAGLEKQA